MLRRRLLILTSTFPRWFGDTQPPFVFELCKRLADRYEVFVLAPHASGAKTQETDAKLHITRFRYFFSKLETLAYNGGILANLKRNPLAYALIPFFFVSQLIAAVRIIRRHRIELIHAHWIIPQGVVGGLIRAFMRPSPFLLCTSHGSDLHKLKGGAFRRISRWAMQQADAITVVSNALRENANALAPNMRKLQVISMGIDATSRFTPDSATHRDDQSLLFVGRLVADKGAMVLFRALPKVLQQFPRLRLYVVGQGPEESALKNFSEERGLTGNISFLGPVANSDLPELYRKATLFVSSSSSEGFGLTLAEALACECPVVATDLPAIRDLVINGKTGLTVRPNDHDDLADKILALLRNPDLRQHFAEQGCRHVRQHYDWARITDQYCRLIDSLLDGQLLSPQVTL